MNTQTVTNRTAPLAPAPTTAIGTAGRVADDGFAALLSHAADVAPEPVPEPNTTATPAGSPAVAAPATPAMLPTPVPTRGAGTTSPGTIGALLAAAGSSGSVDVAGTLAQLIGPVPVPVPSTSAPLGGAGSTEVTLTGDMEQRRAALQPLFEAAGARYGVDPDLLAAVAWTESSFQPDVVSHAGAIGLMQIMPGTAGDLGVDPRDPAQAIDGAARYLRDAFDQFGDVRLALAAYNAGPGAVASHGGIPPYPETTAYVVKVMDRYESLRGAST